MPTDQQIGRKILTLGNLVGGYQGYTSPDLLIPQFWKDTSNVYAGLFGTIRRARWAPVVNAASLAGLATGTRMESIFGYFPPTGSPYLIMDTQNSTYGNSPVVNTYGTATCVITSDFTGFFGPASLRFGPFMRLPFSNGAFILQANGAIRSKLFYSGGVFQFEFWGIDSPDSSSKITIAAGSTKTIVAATGANRAASNVVTITTTAAHGFVVGQWVGISGVTDTSFNTATGTAVQIITVPSGTTFTFLQTGATVVSGSGTVTLGITKTIGRSYQWAWENSNTAHVSAPSPASEYTKYTAQTGTIDLIQPGTVAVNNGSTAVVGTGTVFTSAWVGRFIWVEGTSGPFKYSIASVTDSTHMTLNQNWLGTNQATSRFQIYDNQVTNVRLYATGDGQPVYFLLGRNTFDGTSPTLAASGLEFIDTANSEPPNAPFTNEIAQIYNIPPPIGFYLQDYQSRALVYGVTAAPGTFFYSNIEATVVGQPSESFSPLNTVALPIGDGKLNGMANLPTGLIIWSNRQDMFKLTGLLSDNTIANQTQLGATIQRLPYKIGCGSPYATAVTPLGAIWLSADREVWLFTDNYAPKNVGLSVQDILNRINGARLGFARMTYYKRGERSWLALAVALDSSTFNNKLLLLDLNLLASNGEPSYYTFDMATNAPTWYQYDINCESMTTAYDSNSVNHLLVGDVDLVTEVDWQAGYYTTTAEQNVTGSNKLHAFGNDDAQIVKTFEWMRVLTNQQPVNLASQGWAWAVDSFDDDANVIGVNPLSTALVPGTDSNATALPLEYSPALFKFGGVKPVKGRRFQLGTTFPSTPGFWELRGFEISYMNLVGR